MLLPYAADAAEALSPAELAVLRNQYEKEATEGHVSVQTKFNYAWGLVKSTHREEMVEGVNLFADIYRQAQNRRRECVYYLALGHYKLGNYEEARRFNSLLLSREPTNQQARSLGALIDQGMAKGMFVENLLAAFNDIFDASEGYIGMAITAGAATFGGILLASLLRRR